MDMLPYIVKGLGSSPAVYAEKAAAGVTVHWRYSGPTVAYFEITLFHNGRSVNATKVGPGIQSYTFPTENPSPSKRLSFSVMAYMPAGAPRKTVGRTEEYSSILQLLQSSTQTMIAENEEDNMILTELDEISKAFLGLPLTPEMGQQYLTKVKDYRASGKSMDEAYNSIAIEFEKASDNEDVAFYESRTGNIITGSDEEDEYGGIDPELLTYIQKPPPEKKTAGASGNNDMLIYGGIALVGLYLLFGSKGKGLSGTARKIKTSVRKTQRRKVTKR